MFQWLAHHFRKNQKCQNQYLKNYLKIHRADVAQQVEHCLGKEKPSK